MIGLTEKIQIQIFRCAIAQNILNQRQPDKCLTSRRGLLEQLLEGGHAESLKRLEAQRPAALSHELLISERRGRELAVSRSRRRNS